jgi:hypothetical protein
MKDHLSVQGRPNPRGGVSLFLVSKQNLKPFYWHNWHIKNYQKRIRIEKVTTPQGEGAKNSEKQTFKYYKAHSWSPKKFLVCCYVAIRMQRTEGVAPIAL